jgi:histidine ammonia-lyase
MHFVTPDLINIERVGQIAAPGAQMALSEEARRRIGHCRRYLEHKLSEPDALHYGINTGFGALCNIRIPQEDIERLQYNLVLSHAAGTGDVVPPEIARIMTFLKIQSLSYGHSGVRESLVQRLVDFFNAGIGPVLYELGSLGASGDLAPLAHFSLPLIGMGEVWLDGRRQRADVVLQTLGWAPLTFQAKEALALLNGTQFSTAYAVWCLLEAKRLMRIADLNAAIGFDAFNCRRAPLHPALHRIRPHMGQLAVAKNVSDWLQGSEIAQLEKTDVQDPYAFRCVPQVHGASLEAIKHVEGVVNDEVNAVTDNPNIFPDEDLILSGGNFHAQPLALTLDYLGIALAELGSISERRAYQLLGGQRGLPLFLADDPGLNSGMMIAQYTAAAIVNQNKTLCSPASVDSIVSSNGQEDHVSMAANAATKARKIVLNLERLLAIEFMIGVQALEYRRPLRSSPRIEALVEAYRNVTPRLSEDRVLSGDIEKTIGFLRR